MIGNQPSLTGNIAAKTISVIAVADQTLFQVRGGYNINQINVYRNGVRSHLDLVCPKKAVEVLLARFLLLDGCVQRC